MMAEIRRPLSAVERWYWLSDQFSALNVISRVRVHGRLSIDDLRRGLDALQARHPLLRGGGGGGRGGGAGPAGAGRPPPPPPAAARPPAGRGETGPAPRPGGRAAAAR
ncbi:hypothetical protein QCC52_30125, partial [Pseudomonas aeruginosa]|nr:hypothetical protein [Pseudomonas aeruginosa]